MANCLELHAAGYRADGVYWLRPGPLPADGDMEDPNELAEAECRDGWTVIASRGDHGNPQVRSQSAVFLNAFLSPDKMLGLL